LVEEYRNNKSLYSSRNDDEIDNLEGTPSKRKRSSTNIPKVMREKKRAIKTPLNVESVEDDDEKEFIVDDILDMRNEDGEDKYLVHWEGYSSDHDSWEPIDDLKNLKIFKEFQIRQKK